MHNTGTSVRCYHKDVGIRHNTDGLYNSFSSQRESFPISQKVGIIPFSCKAKQAFFVACNRNLVSDSAIYEI